MHLVINFCVVIYFGLLCAADNLVKCHMYLMNYPSLGDIYLTSGTFEVMLHSVFKMEFLNHYACGLLSRVGLYYSILRRRLILVLMLQTELG